MSEDRKSYQDPENIITKLNITSGTCVADLGCGPGFFTIPISNRIGITGKVYAVDSNPVMIDHLRRNLGQNALNSTNVVILGSDVAKTQIPSESVDVTLFANILHDLSDKKQFLDEVKRVSKPIAEIVDIDWQKRDAGAGPPIEKRLSEQETRHILKENGLEIVHGLNAGPYHYGFVCKK